MKHHPAFRWLAFALLLLCIPAALSSPSSAQIGIGVAISVRVGPPALPIYEQPFCPGPGYLWTPGFWAWSDDVGYYWVPGTWVEAPEVGLLWTPGYWGWNDGVYAWNEGYWGPEIGFYGGINYGFGYGGEGFVGGEWRGGAFFYNTAVMRVNETEIRNVYVNREVVVNNESHVAFNGGEGVAARPTARQEAYAHEKHTPPVASQVQHAREASRNPELAASRNHGAPPVAATPKPGQFSGAGVVRAKAAGAPYHAPAMSPKEARASKPAGNHSASAAKEPRTKPSATREKAHAATPRTKTPAHEGNITRQHRGRRLQRMRATLTRQHRGRRLQRMKAILTRQHRTPRLQHARRKLTRQPHRERKLQRVKRKLRTLHGPRLRRRLQRVRRIRTRQTRRGRRLRRMSRRQLRQNSRG